MAATFETHSKVLCAHVPPHTFITLVTHRHQVPSPNPRGGLYSLPTHTHTGFPRGTLNAFFFQIYPVPHGFSLLRATNHRITQKLKEGGGKKVPRPTVGHVGEHVKYT